MSQALPTFRDVEAAAGRLKEHAVETPLLEAPLLNRLLGGGRLLVKAECLQVTGSFKFRGAFNKISQLDEDARRRGVVAYSSGNHAQGVAAAAHLLGARAVIVMPEDAPAVKLENTRAWGAEVVTYPRHGRDREAIAAEIAQDRGLTIVAPYDDPDVIAGQGTVGLEIARQAAALGAAPDRVVVCCGGGGLTAGTALALKAKLPGATVHTSEPEGWDDTRRSLEAGTRLAVETPLPSVCDALLARTPGELTFAINRDLVASGYAVCEQEVGEAMALAHRYLKIVLEPGGAAALAAVTSGKAALDGQTVVVVGSGGNVDAALFCDLVTKHGR
jgi:threonine dehydratase